MDQTLQEQAEVHVVQALTWESSVVHLQLKMAAARAPHPLALKDHTVLLVEPGL